MIQRDFLNPKNKAVWLIKKGGYYLLEYCFNKGNLLKKEILTEKQIGCNYNITFLHLYFYINGYYAYIDIKLDTKNGLNPNSALYWGPNLTLMESRLNCYGHGISIHDEF